MLTMAPGWVAVSLGIAMMLGETQYGISRSAVLSGLPDMGCVRRILDGIEEIEQIDEQHVDEGMSEIAGRRSEFHMFTYRGQDIDAFLVFRVSHEGLRTYRQSHEMINRKPPRALILATRRVMLKIEKALAVECGLPQLVEGVRETCTGVDCGD